MSPVQIEKRNENYCVLQNGSELEIGKTIAFCVNFDEEADEAILLKFGDPAIVKSFADHHRSNFLAYGFQNYANQIHYIESSDITVDQIDKIVNISGYVGKFLKQKMYN